MADPLINQIDQTNPIQMNQTSLDHAETVAGTLAPGKSSGLANALKSPALNLNQAERNKLISDVAKTNPLAFYANDAFRSDPSASSGLKDDQKVIANGLQQALSDHAINLNDLEHIANVNPPQNGGAQRFMNVLMQADGANQPGSAADQLANNLFRGGSNGTDKAAAAVYYTSSPQAMQRGLTTPQQRLDAFNSLVDLNQSAPYSSMLGTPLFKPLGTQLQNQAIGAESNLFAAHGPELTGALTQQDASTLPKPQVLAQFASQTVFNPSAQNIQLNDGSTLQSSMPAALQKAASSLMSTAQKSEPNSAQQSRAIEQYARLSASLAGGAALALTHYDAQVQAYDASAKQVSDLVGGAVGQVVPLHTPFGNPAEKGAGSLSEQLYNTFVSKPQRPVLAAATDLQGNFQKSVEQLRAQPGQPASLVGTFEGVHAYTVNMLEGKFNINLGGHAN